MAQDKIWVSDKNTRKHNIQENEDVSPFPTGYHKAARNDMGVWQKKTHDKKDPQKKHRLRTVSKKVAGGLKLVS